MPPPPQKPAEDGSLETFLVSQAKLPGYTGFRPGVRATMAKTPAMAQLVAASATPRGNGAGSSTLALTTPAPQHSHPPALFPVLQPPGPQSSARPGSQAPARGAAPGSCDMSGTATPPLAMASCSSTAADFFAAPCPAFSRLRSPMRNKELEEAVAVGGGSSSLTATAPATLASPAAASMHSRYSSAHARVGGAAAVEAMMSRMRARLLAKLGGAGDNAFRLRKLFRRYDAQNTGRVSLEDFRQMAEAVGLQLGDDALLALFFEWDGEGRGTLAYEPFVRALLADDDAFALFSPEALGGCGGAQRQAAAEKQAAGGTARAIASAARGGSVAVRRVVGAMAASSGGALDWREFCSALAAVGVSLSPMQQEHVRAAYGSDAVDWRRFCDALDKAEEGRC